MQYFIHTCIGGNPASCILFPFYIDSYYSDCTAVTSLSLTVPWIAAVAIREIIRYYQGSLNKQTIINCFSQKKTQRVDNF